MPQHVRTYFSGHHLPARRACSLTLNHQQTPLCRTLGKLFMQLPSKGSSCRPKHGNSSNSDLLLPYSFRLYPASHASQHAAPHVTVTSRPVGLLPSNIAFMTGASKKSSTSEPHPYLHGNFAPIHRVRPLTACTFTGAIPGELAGGEYIRNGGNPVTNEELGRDAHWFDGDGMLSGVAFRRKRDGSIQPQFVNQYILTDAYLSTVTTPSLRLPILPSIATLVNPASSFINIARRIMRTSLLVVLSHLAGSRQAIKKISVANTGVVYHDGRALATCESGPPMRVALPGLETVGWFDGRRVEGEISTEVVQGDGFGGAGLLSFMKEWTTAHPRVDPITNELILFHSTFIAPFVHYSIVPSTQHSAGTALRRLINGPVPGIKSAKMMHDFGVSLKHTVIMDLPLSLDPFNLLRASPIVAYDSSSQSRFGVFPRWDPSSVTWFVTNPCVIFHTANTWDSLPSRPSEPVAVNMLACRLTSASLIYSAGAVAAPMPAPVPSEEEQCRLYYYRFSLSATPKITHEFALSTIPFEFPTLSPSASMHNAKFIYGCSLSTVSTFSSALGRAVKIDCLVKMDVETLIARAESCPPTPVTGAVDKRSVRDILESKDPLDPIKIFKLPDGFYAQEARFVGRHDGKTEDDGWILFYVFDESQLDEWGNAPVTAKSELWIVDARDMKTLICRVKLPQRVPYGLHGSWFSEDDILNQRPIEGLRHLPMIQKTNRKTKGIMICADIWTGVRNRILRALG